MIKWTATAVSDLAHIKNSIEEDNPEAALRVVQHLVTVAENQLVAFPPAGRAGRVHGTREHVLPRLPYNIIGLWKRMYKY
jgi:plasmid stabilization system protein ParE